MKELPITTRFFPGLRAGSGRVWEESRGKIHRQVLTGIDFLRILNFPERKDVIKIHPFNGEFSGDASKGQDKLVVRQRRIPHVNQFRLRVNFGNSLVWWRISSEVGDIRNLTVSSRKLTPYFSLRTLGVRHSSLVASVVSALLSFVLLKSN